MNVAQQLHPHEKDLGGGFNVRRLLPAAQRQSVGPFVFFDHFGPVHAQPADNHDVRPHPHIGLSTVTYLFEGAMMHRDSLGTVQRIEPGAINWMTAGRGIVHSERTPQDLRNVQRVSHGLQLWAALPVEQEEVPPSFSHTPADALPLVQLPGAAIRVLIGTAFGHASPVPAPSPTLYVDMRLEAGASITLDVQDEELALYSVQGNITVNAQPLAMHTLGVLERSGAAPVIHATHTGARVMLIGGQSLGKRFMWWNFVSSRKERIEQASADWQAQRMGQIAGETEWIPLPERQKPKAQY
jgi:redox-sensitive bicupin YhaK (pirin superfamily)